MKNKMYKHILKAFLSAKIPDVDRCQLDLESIDEVLCGFSTRVLHGDKAINMQQVITKETKKAISEQISRSKGESKVELIIYYRLAVLTEEILFQVST